MNTDDNRFLRTVLLLIFFSFSAAVSAMPSEVRDTLPEKSDILIPDETIVFAQRDTCSLKMDIYHPMEGSITTYGGHRKPTILYVFGGGFVAGERDAILQLRYYKRLIEEGFRVVAIDYRLGLKGIKGKKVSKISMIGKIENALLIGVEDLFSAAQYLIVHGYEYGIDPDNIVVAGASAGAMIALQADYILCRRDLFIVELPEAFRFRGIISFSGGVFSREGRPDYHAEPAPTLLFHGKEDRIVNYKKIRFFNIGFFGSSGLAPRLKKYGAGYNIYRYEGCGHEVASSFGRLMDEQLDFIYTNVMDGKKKIIDASLSDPSIDTRFKVTRFKDLYK